MKIDEDLWAKHQYGILVCFMHHLAYYRILSKAYKDFHGQSEFWTMTINAHILLAVINWCMIFGTDSNELHWKKVVTDEKDQACFRDHLLGNLGLTYDQWKYFRSNMVDFRNSYAAHRNSLYPSTPTMDIALQAVTTYDEWFRSIVIATFDEPLLSERFDRLIRSSSAPLRHAVEQGPELVQEYEGKMPPP